jgi:hypothetical protein
VIELRPYQKQIIATLLAKRNLPVVFDHSALVNPVASADHPSAAAAFFSTVSQRASKSSVMALNIKRLTGKSKAFEMPYGLDDLPPRRPSLYYHVQYAIANWQ